MRRWAAVAGFFAAFVAGGPVGAQVQVDTSYYTWPVTTGGVVWAVTADGVTVFQGAAEYTAQRYVNEQVAACAPLNACPVYEVTTTQTRRQEVRVVLIPRMVAEPLPPEAPVVAAVSDLRIVECGETWCDLAWTHVGADGYAIWSLTSSPATLIEDAGVPPTEAWPAATADSITWEVDLDGGGVGTIDASVVRSGSCAWPVPAVGGTGGELACRAEGLVPGTPYRFAVRGYVGDFPSPLLLIRV